MASTRTPFRSKGILAAFLLWLGAIFYFSSESYQSQTIIPFLRRHWTPGQLIRILPDIEIRYGHYRYGAHHAPYLFIEFIFRKCAHLFMYAGLGGLAFLLLGGLVESFWKRLPVSLLLVALFASADEWNQSRSAGRTPAVQDVLLDVTGATLGILIVLLLLWIFPPSRRNMPNTVRKITKT
ncbi:VanZ family protein [Cohnella sp. REN36]|uniref:VanZ family protein n=1 Tax=Cohnella sp. REN36 TaxID=2887347 RepID=UPI001D15C498|nr:VanZ family protein [Cohnella sp. REN36]MCC3376004.1 VanZ family protein [Cohnella sp. REN36]